MGYCLAIKRNEVLKHSTNWMNIESSMIGEGNQSKDHTIYGSLYKKYPRDISLHKVG